MGNSNSKSYYLPQNTDHEKLSVQRSDSKIDKGSFKTNIKKNIDNSEMKNNINQVIVTRNYEAQNENELSVKEGQKFNIIDDSDPSFLKVESVSKNELGNIPVNCAKKFKCFESNDKNLSDSMDSQFVKILIHDMISTSKCEEILKIAQKTGSFLIRKSENQENPYILSIIDDKQEFQHYKIKCLSEKGYSIDQIKFFPDLDSLINHCRYSNCLSTCRPIFQIKRCSIEDEESYDDCEINFSEIDFQEKLYDGNFSEIWKAKLIKTDVDIAVKKFKEGTTKCINSKKEVETMKRVNHSYILKLVAIIKKPQPCMIVFEFMDLGSLNQYLPKMRNNLKCDALLSTAFQCCQGMSYLESQRIVHRDLAARNVLISSKGYCKISDFGMAITCNENGKYIENWSKYSIRWTSIESMKIGEFSSKSDVWSFGVLVWEIFSFCDQPYSHIESDDEVKDFVFSGKRLSKPTDCPEGIYNIMLKTWNDSPDDRPTFHQLIKESQKEDDQVESVKKITVKIS